MSHILDNALAAVGQTPLVRLDKIAKANGLKCNLCEPKSQPVLPLHSMPSNS